MPYRRSRSRRCAARRRRNRLLIALTAGGLTCVLLLASSSLFAPGEASERQDAREPPVAASDPSPEPGHRTLYPYSVVPGGVHSPAALAAAVSDPVVAEHYAPVDIAHARVVSVAEPRRAYVSYRIGDRVYWTKHTVALHAGEQLLTDGVRAIRTRCGNRISETPQTPTAADEPDVAEFDRAMTPVADSQTALVTMPSNGPFGIQPDVFSAGDLAFSPDAAATLGGVTLPPGGVLFPPGMDAVDTFAGGPSGGSLSGQNIPLGGFPTRTHGNDVDQERGSSDVETSGGDSPGSLLGSPAATGPDDSLFRQTELPPPIAPIPEPGSMILVGTGLAGCALRAWQRRRRDRQ